MRLLKLRIENINSLAGRYEIDFTNRDYVESGIFAIVGPTGSGKTTILDAVTLALFGKTPRMETRTSTSKKTDRGCMVLTEGRKQCSASVVFESMGKFWRSRWSVRLKRTGEPRDAQVELVRLPDGSAETGEIVAEQKLAWNAKVPEVLGMDYETFTRSALLAQGAFTELLRAPVRLPRHCPRAHARRGFGPARRLAFGTRQKRAKTCQRGHPFENPVVRPEIKSALMLPTPSKPPRQWF